MRRTSEDEQSLRERTAYLHGRIEREIEAFADSINVSKVELTQRLGALLLGIGTGHGDYLSHLSTGRSYMEARTGSTGTSPLESLGDTSSSSPQPEWTTTSISAGQITKGEIERKHSKIAKGYWARMTPAQRSQEMQRRQSLWSTAAKKKWRRAVPDKKKKTVKKTKTVLTPVVSGAAA